MRGMAIRQACPIGVAAGPVALARRCGATPPLCRPWRGASAANPWAARRSVRSLALSAAAAAAASQPLLSFAAASAAHLPLAMVNVDFASPSLVLGTALIGCGIALLQTRNLQRRVSRDADIVVAAMVSIVGSTLIFQGWRLDPLLLLCQALTTSVAVWYGLEAFKLRAQVQDEEEDQPLLPPPADQYYSQQQQQQQQPQDFRAGGAGYLPPGADRVPPPWQQQQQQAAAPPQWGGRYVEETIAYDYYGNPIPQQQPMGVAAPMVDGGGYGPGPSGGAGGLDLDGDYASIAAGAAAAGAAAAAAGVGPSGRGYYGGGAAPPAQLYGPDVPYYGEFGSGGAPDPYGPSAAGGPALPGPDVQGAGGGYGPGQQQGQAQQQQQGQQDYGGPQWRPARRGPGEYDAVDDWQ